MPSSDLRSLYRQLDPRSRFELLHSIQEVAPEIAVAIAAECAPMGCTSATDFLARQGRKAGGVALDRLSATPIWPEISRIIDRYQSAEDSIPAD